MLTGARKNKRRKTMAELPRSPSEDEGRLPGYRGNLSAGVASAVRAPH